MADSPSHPSRSIPGLLPCLRWCGEARWQRLSRWPEGTPEGTTQPLSSEPERQFTMALARASGRWLQRHRPRSSQDPLDQEDDPFDLGVRLAFVALALCEQFVLLEAPEPAQRQARRFLALLRLLALQAGVVFGGVEEQEWDRMGQRLPHRLAIQAQARRFLSQDPPQRFTFVLGMHRSGTSALGGLLCQAGLEAPFDLMEPNAVNPKGFWESQGLFELNEDLFQDLQRTWMSLDPLPETWIDSPAADRWRLLSLAHLTNHFPQGTHGLIKDPRYCLLLSGLEDWWECGAIEVSFLLTLRDPLEVAHSLVAAHPLGLEHALHLWLLYGFAAERASRGYPRMIVEFQQLLEQPQSVLTQALPLVHGSGSLPDAARVAEASGFIDPSLHRQRVEPSEAWDPGAAPSLQRVAWIAAQVYAILRDLAMEGSGETEAAVAALTRLEQLWILGGSTLPHQDQPTSTIGSGFN